MTEVTLSARRLPLLMWPADDGRLSKNTCTWPPIRSVSAGPAPLYGTWTMLQPVIDEQFAREMRGRAAAGRCHAHLARVGLA